MEDLAARDTGLLKREVDLLVVPARGADRCGDGYGVPNRAGRVREPQFISATRQQ